MAPPTPPPAPIIKRTHSPNPSSPAAVSNAALKSPQFVDPPASSGAGGGSGSTSPIQHAAATGYFSPQPSHTGTAPHSPNPSSILINRTESARSPDHLHLHGGAAHHHQQQLNAPGVAQNAGLGVLRVASPDGSTSESGLSSASFLSGGGGGDGSSTAPSSAVGSPPATATPGGTGFSKPLLSTLHVSDPDPAVKRASSPPSPHCHFAPLPKVDNEARPGTRRNSFANRVKPFKGPPERSDSMMSAANDDAVTFSPSLSPTFSSQQHGDPSIPTPSALSQRLSSSLTFAAPPTAAHSRGGDGHHSPSRPTSRRSSSSRRSRSPSPPPHSGAARSSSRGPSVAGGGIYRSHSPNLSRHASTDALSLHYIEAGAERERGGAALSRTSSRAGSERDGGAHSSASSAAAGEEGAFLRRGTSVERSRSSSNSPFFFAGSGSGGGGGDGGGGGMKDKDKEADLHRLEKKAQEGNVDAERAVSPALRALAAKEAAQAARERSLSRGSASAAAEGDAGERPMLPPPGLKRKASNEEVVTVGPGEEKDDEAGGLEEVVEEEEEEEGAEGGTDEEGGNTATDEEEEEEEEEGTDEEVEEEEEEEEEQERSRDEDDEEDEDEEEEMEERKTSKGAAVVRWHRPERDEPSPAPPPSSAPVSPRPAPPPVGSPLPPSVPSTSAAASPALPQEGVAH
ncbi:hypothetical protein JCM6882_008790 [Rhodosporidiobolus microsporus]